MKKKILVACLCVALAVLTVAGTTLAYLTSQAEVKNTFTVGNVKITMDETDTDDSTPNADRDQANSYKLMPGKEYTKDPIIHVDANSEDCWIFVKVENGISAFEAATAEDGYKTIADQITANGWAELTGVTGVTGVYYKSYTKSTAGADLVVFGNFQISDTANTVDGWNAINTKNITVTAYAIQKEGFTTAAAAWAKVGN